MKAYNITLYILVLVVTVALIAAGCGTTDSDSNGGDPPPPPPPPPPTFSLSTAVSPQDAGSVSPSSGSFEEAAQVNVEASSNEGWRFDRWSGDIESTDNPLSFSITSNTSLTANFIDVTSAYTISLTAANSGDEIGLTLGQQSQPESVEAPPAPPQGAFHAWLERDRQDLFTDILGSGLTEAAWQLNLQPGQDEDTVTLNWQLDVDRAEGSLILTDPSGSFEVDMFAEDNYQVDASQTGVLIIEYTLD
jgi:hypothetical protein